MAIDQFSFSKTWRSASDFPTYEPDETQVREDMQCLHDEMADYVNNTLVPAINAGSSGGGSPVSTMASEISFASSAGVPATNVQDAVENVQSQLAGISQGAVADGSITTGKLGDLAVTTAKINDGAVTEDKIANNSVTANKIPDGSISLAKLSSDARSPISVEWEDVSEDVTLYYPTQYVRSMNKVFMFSSALGLMFFSITCGLNLSAGSSLVSLGQRSYKGSISREVAVPVGKIGYAATLNAAVSSALGYDQEFTIYIGDDAVSSTVTISGFYPCNGA